jgi:hypothetical protein
MSTSFPDQKDSYTRKTDNVDDVMAAHSNDAYDAVEAAEDALLDFMNHVPPVGLHIRNNAATPNTQIDLDADRVMIEGYQVDGLDVTIDITTTGTNGRPSDESQTNSVFWYVWAIYNPTSSTAAGLLSQKYGTDRGGTNPTLPSGYTKKRLLGSVYRDSSGNFRKFVKRGDMVTTDGIQILNCPGYQCRKGDLHIRLGGVYKRGQHGLGRQQTLCRFSRKPLHSQSEKLRLDKLLFSPRGSSICRPAQSLKHLLPSGKWDLSPDAHLRLRVLRTCLRRVLYGRNN